MHFDLSTFGLLMVSLSMISFAASQQIRKQYRHPTSKALQTHPAGLAHRNLSDVTVSHEWCRPVFRNIGDPGPHIKTAMFIGGSGGALALGVCRMLGYSNCYEFAYSLSGGLAALWFIVFSFQGAESLPNRLVNPSATTLSQQLTEHLQSSGMLFADITSRPILMNRSRILSQQARGQIIDIRGLQSLGETIDLQVVDFGNGNGHISIQPTQRSTSAGRNGAGFKVSYNIEHPIENADMEEARRSASAFANDWAFRAEVGKIDQYIGRVSTGPDVNFKFRIIPEVRGFGTEYEPAVPNGCSEYRGEL